jgi:hypothetical protein
LADWLSASSNQPWSFFWGIYDVAKGVLKFYMCASFLWLKHEYSATISIGHILGFLLEIVVPCGVFFIANGCRLFHYFFLTSGGIVAYVIDFITMMCLKC